MSYRELIVLLPCHSLEDFPAHLEGADAENLLAACTAVWHPSLIAAARQIPIWCRADVLPGELAGRLLIVPEISDSWLPHDFAERVEAEGATVVRGDRSRDKIIRDALAGLTDVCEPFAEDVVSDFLALGFCRWHTELLTRFSRYTSTLDEIRLQTDVLAAIDAAIAKDVAGYREHLQQAFNRLDDARKYYHPNECFFIDLTLVAEATIGESLRMELASSVPTNLLICGEVLEQMAEREPKSVAALKTALERGTVSLVGGEYHEREFPLLPEEIWRDDLLKGIAAYERIAGRRPIVYGRRRAGLSPLLPQLLCRTGFSAALHFTLDDGRFPTSPVARVLWNSPDGSLVEAIAQVPIDATKTEPFLELSRRLGEALDREEVATFVFAHWPGNVCTWYADLRRAAKYTSALGRFVTLENYFTEAISAANHADFNPDEYRTPYLQQSIAKGEANLLSQFCDRYNPLDEAKQEITKATLTLLRGPLLTAQPTLEGLVSDDRSAPLSIVAINYHSFPIRHIVQCVDIGSAPDAGPPIYAFDLTGDPIQKTAEAVVDIPAMGFAWVGPGQTANRAQSPREPILKGLTLRNEYCEVTLNPTTGGIQSINDYRTRGNRMSQQISLRMPGKSGGRWHDPDEIAVYSVMVADSIETTTASGAYACFLSKGRLVNLEGEELAKFEQTTALLFGSRVVRMGVKLQIGGQPLPDPWNSYYAIRFAFPNGDLNWFRNIGLGSYPTEARRIEAPLFVEVASSRWKTSILTGGLPFHRRVLDRTLDTLVAVSGDSDALVSVAIGIDVPNPAAEALHEFEGPSYIFTDQVPVTAMRTGWFYHLDAKNVIATAWEPIGDAGFRVRLRETMGAAGRVALRSWRPVKSARQTDFLGNTLLELKIEDDKIWLEITAHAWIQVEALFE